MARTPTSGSRSSSRRPATSVFFLLPVHTWPELREGLSPALARHLTGKATFTFTTVEEPLFAELESLVARAFDRYVAAG